jgi:hypothetical protein
MGITDQSSVRAEVTGGGRSGGGGGGGQGSGGGAHGSLVMPRAGAAVFLFSQWQRRRPDGQTEAFPFMISMIAVQASLPPIRL